MFATHTIFFEGKRYVFVGSLWSNEHKGRKLSGVQALWLLERMLLDINARVALRRIYADLYGDPFRPPNDSQILHRLEHELEGLSGFGMHVLVECDEWMPGPKIIRDDSPEAREIRRLDALLSTLGKDELLHRGRSYRLLRAEQNAGAPERNRFEAVNEHEARSLVREMAVDPQRPNKQREALTELLTAFEVLPQKPRQELLLLRRMRVHVVSESESPAITPSQLRELREEHWIEVEFVDDDKQPVPNIQVLLIHDNGDEKPLRSDTEGRVRWAPIRPGNVAIRLPDLDAELWKPQGGTAGQQTQPKSGYTQYIIKRGDNLSRIAKQYGLKGWKKLWDDPKNEPLRNKRKNPNVIHPGDEVMVPGKTVQEIVRAVDTTHRIVVECARVRSGHVLDSQDLNFHSGSCVFLGECSDLTDPQTLSGASGVDALATALLYARDNSAQKLLIVGHSDASGAVEKNQKLSERRALALKHLLLGDRAAWVKLVKEHSTIADYQQILAWLSIVRGWPCTPFEVSGVKDPDNKRILKAFQVSYNKHFDASIDEDGAIGPETWGAIFDVYEQQLEYRLETDRAGLTALRGSVQFCGVGETHGGGSALALRAGAAEAKTEDAAAYRRAELMFFEPGEEPTAVDLEEGPPASPDFSFTQIPAEKGAALVWLSVQTVDELGFRLGHVELAFRSGDAEVRHTTDSHGLWRGQVNAQGTIEVSVASGSALGLGTSTEFSESIMLSPQWAATVITDIVVQGAVDADLLEEHERHVARYDAAPDHIIHTLRSGLRKGALPAREPMEVPDLSGEGTVPTRRAIRSAAADNLFMAARLDPGKLNDVVKVWLEDRYGRAILDRGYMLEVYTDHHVAIFYKDSDAQHLFNFAPDVDVRGGRIGLHALLATGRERNGEGAIFVDLAQARTVIDIGRRGLHGAKRTDTAESSSQPDTIEVVRTAELVAERERNDYLKLLWNADARGLVRLAYLWRSSSKQVAASGGTGVLESYPSNATLREHVHGRNKAVTWSMRRAYGEYIDNFIEKVQSIHPDPAVAKARGEMHPELQLYALLPPLPTVVLPTPPGITTAELAELLRQDPGSSEFMAWKAIAQKHNEIWRVRTAGSMWLVTEFSASAGFGKDVGGGGELALKLNFEVSTDSKSEAIEVSQSSETTIFLKGLELDPETGIITGKLENEKILGPFAVEADSNGKVTLSYGGATASYERSSKQVSVGVGGGISLRDLVERGMKRRGKDWGELGEPEWLKKLPEIKAEVSLNVQLSRPSDIMSVITRSPGLMALGPRLVFMHADWGSLGTMRKALETLGWDEARWDEKRLPPSAKTQYDMLTPAEKRAALQLPVPKEGHWIDFWKDFAR